VSRSPQRARGARSLDQGFREGIWNGKSRHHHLAVEGLHHLSKYVCQRDNVCVAVRIASHNVAVHLVGCLVHDGGAALPTKNRAYGKQISSNSAVGEH